MNEQLKDALFKGVVMWLRLAVMGAIPTIVLSLEKGAIDKEALFVTVLIASLKALDEVLHKYGKQIDSASLSRGITRF